MAQIDKQAVVLRVDKGIYRIDLPPKMKLSTAFIELGNYRLNVEPDKVGKYAVAVIGAKKDLLLWLSSLKGLSPEALKSFEDEMTEE
jgi:hypothetical protein